MLVVPPSRPYKSVPELVAAARSANGTMTFATVGVGSIPQFLGILLQLRADVKLIEVPARANYFASQHLNTVIFHRLGWVNKAECPVCVLYGVVHPLA